MNTTEIYNIAIEAAECAANYYSVDSQTLANYLVKIAQVESGGNPKAKNKNSTARGLMQMLICTQRENEKKRLKINYAPAMYSCKSYPTEIVAEDQDKIFEPEYSMALAAVELAYQYDRYKDWEKAIHAYNQGSFPANKSAGEHYVSLVMKQSGPMNNEYDVCYLAKNYILCNSTRLEYY